MRVFAVDLLRDPLDVVRSFEGLEDELGRLELLLDGLAERAESIPHRTQGIELQLSLARRILDAHREWIAEVRGSLTSADPA